MVPLLTFSMKPSVECRKLADLLRRQAYDLEDPELRAEYAYLIRGFLRLARQFERDMDKKKTPDRKTVA